jgi:uncharacterized membrane protein YphA (DoxX/SURF4 family)
MKKKNKMKIITRIIQFVVGIVFLFSGFAKMVDPIGFGYKLGEYFEKDVLNLEFLIPYALVIGILVVIFEFTLGIMLILGYKVKFTLWSMLAMMLFFTLLTFYTAYWEKVTDCGCFGDAVKISPWGTFWKDVIFSILLLVLIAFHKNIWRVGKIRIAQLATIVATLFGLGVTYYALMHLPPIDFRPYKIGNNITEGMSTPEDAPQAIYDYIWTYKVNGENKEFVTQGASPETDGEYVDVRTELVQEGYEPPIHDFTIENDEGDKTAYYLNEPKVLVVVAYNLSKSELVGFENVRKAAEKALAKGYKVIGLTSSADKAPSIKETYKLPFDFYFADETALKTIIRANPALMTLEKGTVKDKKHWNDATDLELK